VNTDARLAEIVAALEGEGIRCLVMGGHAVRFYGLNRNTVDFHLHVAPETWENLDARLGAAPLLRGDPLLRAQVGAPMLFGASRSADCPTAARSGLSVGAATICSRLFRNSTPGEKKEPSAGGPWPSFPSPTL
jgi:hypothetical protein